jgi:COMPASS component SWD2
MLLTTDGDAHYLLNALNGEVMRRLQGHVAMSSATGEEVAFTPDGKYVVGGSDDGSVCVWDVQNGLPDGSPIVSLEGHTKSVTAVGWNPQYAMMVTACSDVCLWQPDYFSLDN